MNVLQNGFISMKILLLAKLLSPTSSTRSRKGLANVLKEATLFILTPVGNYFTTGFEVSLKGLKI